MKLSRYPKVVLPKELKQHIWEAWGYKQLGNPKNSMIFNRSQKNHSPDVKKNFKRSRDFNVKLKNAFSKSVDKIKP